MNEKITRSADKIVSEAVYNIADRLPDDESKKDFVRRVEGELQQGMRAALVGQDYQQHLNRSAYETSVWVANHYADIALNRVVKELPRGKNRDTIHNALEQLTHRGIESFCRGASLNQIKADLADYGKRQVVTWAQGQGAELAAETFRSLQKISEREIKNKVLRDLSTQALTKLSDANTLTQAAGYVIDVGQSLRQLFNGEISKGEFLRVVGEKGSAFVLSGSLSVIGAAIGGAAGGTIGAWIGGAIGSMVGYFATNCLFNSVMRAFDEAELSRKRYEMIREFCDYAIRVREAQRIEFERNVAEFLGRRQEVIDRTLNDYEASMKADDIDGMSAALNELANEFGGELQCKTFDEFDDFMSDPNSTFKL